jgi:hypothetical protein
MLCADTGKATALTSRADGDDPKELSPSQQTSVPAGFPRICPSGIYTTSSPPTQARTLPSCWLVWAATALGPRESS